jgi:hypothetical protein
VLDTNSLAAGNFLVRQATGRFFGTKSEDDTGRTVEVFHILRPEMNRSGLELSIDTSFTKNIGN